MTHTPPPTQDDLAAGRELDWKIHKLVMGREDVYYRPYSSDIGAVWQIVEWAEASPRGWKLTLMRSGRSLPDYVWICTFHRGHVELARVVERSAPVAICKAALQAVSG